MMVWICFSPQSSDAEVTEPLERWGLVEGSEAIGTSPLEKVHAGMLEWVRSFQSELLQKSEPDPFP